MIDLSFKELMFSYDNSEKVLCGRLGCALRKDRILENPSCPPREARTCRNGFEVLSECNGIETFPFVVITSDLLEETLP